jgi:hypothetical protein
MGAHRKFSGQFAGAQDFDAEGAIGQTGAAKRALVHAGTVFKLIEFVKVYHQVAHFMARIIETALGNTADQRHLAAFETYANRTSGTGCLPLATASARFAMAAGFTLTEAFAAVFGSGTRFEIV